MSVFAQYLQPFSSKYASKTHENRCFCKRLRVYTLHNSKKAVTAD